uniref:Uncharacterized protein n=1 Tax=Panagrolaimus sp. ES5 TaxID=591445 RepID=A0AC34FQF9_9BILA
MCINYLCAVNFDDQINNIKVYAYGSGCQKDMNKNCGGPYAAFTVNAHCSIGSSLSANICANKSGVKTCPPEPFFKCLNKTKQETPNDPFGWDHFSDFEWKPDVDGVDSTWNETANTIFPDPITTKTPASTTTPSTTTPSPTTSTPSTTTSTTTFPTTTGAPSSNALSFIALLFTIFMSVFLLQ